MKLAALFSGGKDSVYAAYLAKQMGHEISFLVTIVPKTKDSWMFHTPNLSVVPMLAECMEIELIESESDGTEDGDLSALKETLASLDVDGVVTGAIWSDYQWERINQICGELNYFVLSPLWRKNTDMMYDEMVNSGIEAYIIGVFAEGFDESWLGKKLDKDTKKDLLKLNEKYGTNIMGEGGEFESITLDSPLHKKRLIIKRSENNIKRSAGTLDILELEIKEKDY